MLLSLFFLLFRSFFLFFFTHFIHLLHCLNFLKSSLFSCVFSELFQSLLNFASVGFIQLDSSLSCPLSICLLFAQSKTKRKKGNATEQQQNKQNHTQTSFKTNKEPHFLPPSHKFTRSNPVPLSQDSRSNAAVGCCCRRFQRALPQLLGILASGPGRPRSQSPHLLKALEEAESFEGGGRRGKEGGSEGPSLRIFTSRFRYSVRLFYSSIRS